MASDIKYLYPKEDVVLIHSRNRLMNCFGERLGGYVLATLRDELNVRVMLGERPALSEKGSIMAGPATVDFSDGNMEEFDLVVCPIRCYSSLYYLQLTLK